MVSEERRLRTLYATKLLDTPPNRELDRITRMAALIFKTDIALVTLVDAERQWFKSKEGLDVSETPRDWAFCNYAIHSDSIFEVCDAKKDPRFENNPLVTGPPFIRYYCGAPVIAPNGARLGTLCVISPHAQEPMSRGKRLLLEEMAGQVMKEIALESLRDTPEPDETAS